ncbi:MAG: cobalt-precorrin 5A hydrolase [Spirochaetaceae bacterium]|nr:cobalt-precorrin 5A hydrolase [Spirochaetaceae bacterium]
MKAAFFSFTDCGGLLKSRLAEWFLRDGHEIFEPPHCKSLKESAGLAFSGADALFFIGAAGIAVRTVAPFIRSKTSDPAVIVVDELGKWVIPILGGHIGGGNDLAREAAKFLGGEAVITTATDIHGVFAVDTWAKAENLAISSMEAAKGISAALLRGSPVCLQSDYPIEGCPPHGIVYRGGGTADIIVSMKRTEAADGVLRLIPRRVYAGIGCRRGAGAELIAEIFDHALLKLGLDPRCIAGAASIDLKKTEKGLSRFCERLGVSCAFFEAEELRRVEGNFSASRFVEDVTGVDNVCERAAVLASENGELLLKKTARDGVTIALAVKEAALRFPPGNGLLQQ